MNPFIISRKIFGVSMQFSLKNEESYNRLTRELRSYPEGDNPEIFINEVDVFNATIISSNPKSQIETSEGFILKSLLIDIHFKFDNGEVSSVDFIINEKEGLKRSVRKWVNNQFTNRIENIGQILHETVLVPLMLLRSDRLITHASGVQRATKKALLFGGTGGVGKTSIEIKLCIDSVYHFVADDISVADREGFVYPNLNYPKIYAYNLEGNKKLKDRLFKNRSISDSIQWNIRKNIGLDKVRRKVDPQDIYSLPQEEKMKVDSYYFLFRTNVSEISLEEISAEKASDYSALIIKNEYSSIYNHIRWHEYNRKALGLDVFISENTINMKIDKLGKTFFTNTKSFLLKIPYEMPHDVFMIELPKKINNTLM